ncbi:MAG: AAA family ATPase [Weeksellaceae bacterium]
MAAEHIPVYRNGSCLGSVERDALYHAENDHQIVHTLIYKPLEQDMEPEQMWVQQRGSTVSYLPNYLVTAASGHVSMTEQGIPETFEQAALREASEEVFGNDPSQKLNIQRLGTDFTYKPSYPGYKGGSKQVATFVSESDGANFNPLHPEVSRLALMSVGELKQMSRDPHSLLHPELREILRRKMTRIGIVGTYSVGKTTLTDALSRRINGSRGVTEDVRHYVKNVFGKKGIQELTPEEFIQLEHMLYRDQTLAARYADIAVVDSTPIGCPVYLQNYGLLAENGHQYDQSVIEGWKDKTRSTLDDYDVIVYLPPEIPYENDGFRTGPQFRGPVDQGFQEVIQGHPRMIEVTGYIPGDVSAGVNTRVETVIDYCLQQGILDEEQIAK